jgi:hypothetical protein
MEAISGPNVPLLGLCGQLLREAACVYRVNKVFHPTNYEVESNEEVYHLKRAL